MHLLNVTEAPIREVAQLCAIGSGLVFVFRKGLFTGRELNEVEELLREAERRRAAPLELITGPAEVDLTGQPEAVEN